MPRRRTKTSVVIWDLCATLLYQRWTSGSYSILNLGGEPDLSFLAMKLYRARTDSNCVDGGRAQI